MLCILEPSRAAPAPGSSQHSCHRSQADQAGLQLQVQGKGRTSRALTKIKSRKLGLFYSRMALVHLQSWMLGGKVGKEKRGMCAQVMKFKMKH